MKNKNNKLIYILGLIFLISLTNCNQEYLNVGPVGTLNENNIATKVGAYNLLTGAYARIIMSGPVGSNANYYYSNIGNGAYSDMGSNEEVRGATSVPDLVAYASYTVSPVNIYNIDRWKYGYLCIQRANDVLRLLPKVPASELSAAEATQIKAEAIFLRALMNYEMTITYGKVPYVDETITPDDGNFLVPNDHLIWPEIEADFKFCVDNLDVTKKDKGRPNKWAAVAYLAKVYMQQLKYNAALPLLTDCINNGVTSSGQKYALSPKYYDNFDCHKENGPESVFAIQFAAKSNPGIGEWSNWVNSMGAPMIPGNAGIGSLQVSLDCANAFQTDAVSGLPLIDTYKNNTIKFDYGLTDSDPFIPYTGTLDPRIDLTMARRGIPLLDWGLFRFAWQFTSQAKIRGPYYQIKDFYYKADLATFVENNNWIMTGASNYNLIRFADVLLLAAECEIEATSGNLMKAESYVNQVRARAANPSGWVKTYKDDNDPAKGFTDTPAANYKIGLYTGQIAADKAFARKAVRFERRLELAVEGHRFFDLQRWDKASPGYMGDELNGILAYYKSIKSTYPEIYPSLQNASFTKGKCEIYPIPQREIDLSVINGTPTLTQNPGY